MEKGRERNIKITGALVCNSGKALTDAVLKGLGIAQLPDYYVQEHIRNKRIVSLLENFRQDDDHIWAIYPHNRHLSSKIRMLVDFLADHL